MDYNTANEDEEYLGALPRHQVGDHRSWEHVLLATVSQARKGTKAMRMLTLYKMR